MSAPAEPPRPAARTTGRQPWLDAVKVVATALVVFWHLHPLPTWGPAALPRAVRFFEFEVSLIAVPTFLIASLYLFFAHGGAAPEKLRGRLSRLGGIYLFWTAVQIAVAVALGTAGTPSLRWITAGGPGLPYVYDSIFYYLFDLLALTALGAGYAHLGRARAAVGWTVVVGSALYFEWALLAGVAIPYHRLDAFLLYVPIAHALWARPAAFTRARGLFALGWLVFAAHDVVLGAAGGALAYRCVYGRITVVLGALALLTAAQAAGLRARPLVTLLSTYSLGIYAVHKYFQVLGLWLAERHPVPPLPPSLLVLGVTLVGTAVTLAVLSRTPLRRFVA